MTEEEDVSAETSEDPGYVTRLPNYELASPHPGSWRDALPRIAFTPEMILDYSDEMMQDALGGDLDAAFALLSVKQRCRRAELDPARLEQKITELISLLEQRRESGRPLPDPARDVHARPGTVLSSEQAIRENETNWSQACNGLLNSMTPDMRARLAERAERGDRFARYLYAIWPPAVLGNPTWIEDLDTWSGNAERFTRANLEEGEGLGLLARATSFDEDLPIFGIPPGTGRTLTSAFVVAAKLCGVNHSELDRLAQYLIDHGHQLQGWLAQDTMLLFATQLHQHYCTGVR